MKLTPIKIFAVLAIFIIVFLLSTYKATEAPRTWIDEGLFIQVARNFANYNVFEIQTAPGEFNGPPISTYITVGYPVIYPLALVFKFFGMGLLQARLYMAIFIISLVIAVFYLIYKMFGYKKALITTLLLASFAPLYGNGKNVLGEVPGLFFLVLFLLCINKLEELNFKSRLYYILSGVTVGLAVATKPIFILLIPAILISVFLARKRINLNLVDILYGLVPFFILLVIHFWAYLGQKGSVYETLVFYFYANDTSDAYSATLKQHILTNLWRFFTEVTPAYFFGLTLVWLGYRILMVKLKKSVKLAEEIALIFTILIGFAYLKLSGGYRYFFPGHVLALIFFTIAFLNIFKYLNQKFTRSRIKITWAVFPILLLTVFQFYQVGFSSFVAGYYHETKSEELDGYFKDFDSNRSIFVYFVPEIVTFLRHDNYFQFFAVSDKIIGNREVMLSAIPDEVIVSQRNHDDAKAYLGHYKLKTTLYRNRYFVYERK